MKNVYDKNKKNNNNTNDTIRKDRVSKNRSSYPLSELSKRDKQELFKLNDRYIRKNLKKQKLSCAYCKAMEGVEALHRKVKRSSKVMERSSVSLCYNKLGYSYMWLKLRNLLESVKGLFIGSHSVRNKDVVPKTNSIKRSSA